MRATGSLVGVFSSGGGLIQAALGIGGSTGRLFLNRWGLAKYAESRVAWRVTRMAAATQVRHHLPLSRPIDGLEAFADQAVTLA